MDKQPAQTRYVDKYVRCVRHMPRMRRDRVMFTRVRMRRGKTVCACCVHCVCRGCSETVYVRAYAAGFPKLSARALPCMCEIRVRVLCALRVRALRVRARCVYAVCARRAGCRSSVVRAS